MFDRICLWSHVVLEFCLLANLNYIFNFIICDYSVYVFYFFLTGERNTCRSEADTAGPVTYPEVSEGLLGKWGLDVAQFVGKDTYR